MSSSVGNLNVVVRAEFKNPVINHLVDRMERARRVDALTPDRSNMLPEHKLPIVLQDAHEEAETREPRLRRIREAATEQEKRYARVKIIQSRTGPVDFWLHFRRRLVRR